MARILALDRGAGISDLPRAMADGYSTAGTPGGGLGAMKRIASFLDVFSGKSGTVVMLEVGEPFQPERLQMAGLTAPYPGESVCGDGWGYQSDPERTQVVLVDGLGHGFGAAEAAEEALSTFHARSHSGPGHVLEDMHDPLRKTRGAVVGIAEIRPRENSMIFAGVGNISCSMLSNGRSRSFVSHSGTLGLRMSRVQEFHSDWPPDAVLVLHSDGLQSKWDLSPYAGILSRHAAIIGGVLLRDFRRQRDDASVVVVKAA